MRSTKMRLATEWRLIGHVLMPSSDVERKPLKKQEEEKFLRLERAIGNVETET
jgi:hypothetical protein